MDLHVNRTIVIGALSSCPTKRQTGFDGSCTEVDATASVTVTLSSSLIPSKIFNFMR